MGHADGSDAAPMEPAISRNRPKSAPFKPNSRIAIIGAGPAGISMAYTLRQRGYTNVTIFEKEAQIGGMTRTVWDSFEATIPPVNQADTPPAPPVPSVPHEMGTCYLATFRHRHILDLMDKVFINRVNLPPQTVVYDEPNWGTPAPFGQWIAETIRALFPNDFPNYPWDNPEALAGLLLQQLDDYLYLRQEVFEKPEDVYLFPRNRPNDAHMAELGEPMFTWLTKHRTIPTPNGPRVVDLKLLVPLMVQSQTSQGYGYLKDVPAYYALMWNNDQLFGYPSSGTQAVVAAACRTRAATKKKFKYVYKALKEMEKAAVVASCPDKDPAQAIAKNKKEDNIGASGADYRALMVQDGFQALWIRLAADMSVLLNVHDLKITRRTETMPEAPVLIKFKQSYTRTTPGDPSHKEIIEGEEQVMTFDFLMLAAKYDEVHNYLDVSAEEKKIFDTVKNYELTTTLFGCDHGSLKDLPQAFVMNLIVDNSGINRLYGTRTSLECVRPGLEYKKTDVHASVDMRVGYQFSDPSATTEDLLEQFKADAVKFGAQNLLVPPVLHGARQGITTENSKRWKYMPHFEGSNIKHLWDLWDAQDKRYVNNSTWYLGCLTCFESTADVYSYNVQLCDYFEVGGASSGGCFV